MTLAAGGGLETKQAPKAYSLLFTLYKNDLILNSFQDLNSKTDAEINSA